jgi:hypothetical protein
MPPEATAGIRETGKTGVFRPTRPIRPMAHSTGHHVRFAAMSDNIRQRRVIRRMPIEREKQIPCLRDRERGSAVGNMSRRAVVRLHFEVGRVHRVRPGKRCIISLRPYQALTPPGSLS